MNHKPKHKLKQNRRPKQKRREWHVSSITPANTLAGLSSTINQNYVRQVFDASTPEEVEAVLRSIQYRGDSYSQHRSAAQSNAKAGADVDAFLRTPEGMRMSGQKLDETLRRKADEWLSNSHGKAELTRIKSELLSDVIRRDQDLFTKTCSDALAQEVQKWLRSPLGQAQIEQGKQRALRDEVTKANSPKGISWVQREVKGLSNAK
jgi:hypothetical protein